MQNVIEHSAILCDDTNLAVPAELLVNKSPRRTTGPLLATTSAIFIGGMIRWLTDTVCERKGFNAAQQALEQANGRVSGPSGAAARLGLPPSTLESKIKRHNIDKLRYRGSSSH